MIYFNNDDFMTRDFSPIMKWLLAGVKKTSVVKKKSSCEFIIVYLMYLSKFFQFDFFFCVDYLCDALWEHLNMVRIYTKKPGCPPDFEDPIILKRGSDVKKVCFTLHRDLPDQFKYALVWVSYRDFITNLISYLLNITLFCG